MIDFNRPALVGKELNYIQDAVAQGMLCGDGKYTKLCSEWMKKRFDVNQVFLTTSCTHALEMAAFLSDIQPGDEVIMPSYTFVSTADAFVLRGAKIVFVDIRPDTMNIDENLIEQAITDKTRVIVPVHYAGVACEMNKIMEIAQKYNLKVVEDAAQGVDAYYHGKALGTIGDFGCYSFHETKNFTMGEGGALVFQKNESLCCCLAGKFAVICFTLGYFRRCSSVKGSYLCFHVFVPPKLCFVLMSPLSSLFRVTSSSFLVLSLVDIDISPNFWYNILIFFDYN